MNCARAARWEPWESNPLGPPDMWRLTFGPWKRPQAELMAQYDHWGDSSDG